MFRFLPCLALIAFALPLAAEEKAPSPPEGFTAIFNGKDLDGWSGSDKYWSVEDGCLTGDRRHAEVQPLHHLAGRQGEELRAAGEGQGHHGGNSGLQYRGTERPDLGESVVTGYQCDVVPAKADYNGMLYEERGRRILAHTGEKVVIDPQGQPWVVGKFATQVVPAGRVARLPRPVEGNHHQHWIDGHQTVDVIDLDEKGRELEGVMAVQVHVGPVMKIQYKDFFVKTCPMTCRLITPAQAPIAHRRSEGGAAGRRQAEKVSIGGYTTLFLLQCARCGA